MGLQGTLKKSFVTGFALLAPLLVTIVAFQVVLGWLRGLLSPVIEGTRLVGIVGDLAIAAELLAVAIVVVVVAALGYLAQRSAGRWLFGTLDRVVGVIPLASVVYSSVRQVSNALMRQGTRYESVALVEYPRDGLYAIGFVTAESPRTVTATVGERTVNVYVPNSPNPMNGNLVLVPEAEVTELEMSVSRGIRLLVTTGIAEDERELTELQEEVAEAVDDQDIDLESALEPDDGD